MGDGTNQCIEASDRLVDVWKLAGAAAAWVRVGVAWATAVSTGVFFSEEVPCPTARNYRHAVGAGGYAVNSKVAAAGANYARGRCYGDYNSWCW